ncbi:MAG: leucyl/phenylalanyl-tRNA--protein transferase [Saprospiraceae bacterium]|nr:leucyl/phenylalanyl-tRNA--protein transferase [Saprospiraceae bacterium]
MPVFRLPDDELVFPHPDLADPNGILAVGGDLSSERILLAYEWGIFPWFNPGEPILWWSPDPRFVLFPDELKVSKSMRPYFNQRKFEVSFDERFEDVIRSCQMQKRDGQMGGTWITENMVEAYCQLHELGYAHSVEVWKGEELVGGLYGISLGKIFFGESMFAKESNASKFGFIKLIQQLKKNDFQLIDCQQQTRHLGSLGARAIDRKVFLEYLQKNQNEETLTGKWTYLLEN